MSRPIVTLIGDALAQRGMTQSELAKLCGWSSQRVSHYLTGKRPPRAEDLETMAGALGLIWALVPKPIRRKRK